MKKNAFTMIELVFVIVVLGILAAIAIPKFAATRTDAEISKGRSDVASIRSAIISERQSRLIKGETDFIDNDTLSSGSDKLFDGVLMYSIVGKNASGHWRAKSISDGEYYFKIGDTDVLFKYDSSNGTFTCKDQNSDQADSYCSKLVD